MKCDLSNWIKSELLQKLTKFAVIKFIEKVIILKYNIFILLIIDRGPENKELLIILIKKYKINKIIVFIYYFQANRIEKVGYKFIKNALSKLANFGKRN